MNKEEVNNLVNFLKDYSYTLPMAIEGIEDMEEYRARWVAQADSEWLDIVIDALHDDVQMQHQETDNISSERHWQFAGILGEWAKKDPSFVIPKIGSLLTDDRIRPIIIDALGYADRHQSLKWLATLIPIAQQLSEGELFDLINAIGQINTPKSHILLRQLKTFVEQKASNVHDNIDSYLRL